MERVAVVTGANRGLGFETSRQLARRGLTVVLTSRLGAHAVEAVERLRGEGLDAIPQQLDVTDVPSINALARFLVERFGRLDVLVNNAGVMPDTKTGVLNVPAATVERTLRTNLVGPIFLCQALVPLMQANNYGRVVNVSSQLGQLSSMGAGFPAYRASKVALNAVTCILADEVRGSNVLVNSACPGWVRTDMGGPGAPKTVEEGADTIVWLATLPDDGPTGGFFQNREPLAW